MGMDVYGLDPKKDAENITEIIELEFKLEELVKKRKYVEELKAVLEAQDLNLVDKHITLAMKAPRGLYDDFYLEENKPEEAG